jgi:hypothetical protein
MESMGKLPSLLDCKRTILTSILCGHQRTKPPSRTSFLTPTAINCPVMYSQLALLPLSHSSFSFSPVPSTYSNELPLTTALSQEWLFEWKTQSKSFLNCID